MVSSFDTAGMYDRQSQSSNRWLFWRGFCQGIAQNLGSSHSPHPHTQRTRKDKRATPWLVHGPILRNSVATTPCRTEAPSAQNLRSSLFPSSLPLQLPSSRSVRTKGKEDKGRYFVSKGIRTRWNPILRCCSSSQHSQAYDRLVLDSKNNILVSCQRGVKCSPTTTTSASDPVGCQSPHGAIIFSLFVLPFLPSVYIFLFSPFHFPSC